VTRRYAREAVTRYVTRPDLPLPTSGGRFATPAAIGAFLAPLADELVEVGVVLTLNTKHRLIAYHEISRGTIDTASFHPREVFRTAIADSAASIVIAHNHPSGDLTPSPDDRAITLRLRECGQLLDIELLDSLIIAHTDTTGRGYFSFREVGTL